MWTTAQAFTVAWERTAQRARAIRTHAPGIFPAPGCATPQRGAYRAPFPLTTQARHTTNNDIYPVLRAWCLVPTLREKRRFLTIRAGALASLRAPARLVQKPQQDHAFPALGGTFGRAPKGPAQPVIFRPSGRRTGRHSRRGRLRRPRLCWCSASKLPGWTAPPSSLGRVHNHTNL